MNPANTSTDSKLDVTMKSSVSADCTMIATYGSPSLLVRDRKRKGLKSSPITSSTLGPARVIALTVEMSSNASAPPANRPPTSPKAYSAAI